MEAMKMAKRSLVKVVQKAANSTGVLIEGLLDELPNTDQLARCRKLSIKLDDKYTMNIAISRFVVNNALEFDPVTFSIRDEDEQKRQILSASLHPYQGFVVGDPVCSTQSTMMHVTLPSKSDSYIGKIEHPCGATLYKMVALSRDPSVSGAVWYNLHKTSSNNNKRPILTVSKHRRRRLAAANAAGFSFIDGVYRLETSSGVCVAKVAPKFAPSNNTFIVKYKSNDVDTEMRAAVLGAALMLVLNDAYPELRDLLKSTIVNEQQ